MLLKLWNYLRGYVIIEVAGFSVERFLNLAAHHGIFIWDVSRSSAAATMKVSVKAFKLLKPFAKKTGCKVKIVKKRGAPFIVYRYRNRKLLAFGLFFFIFALYFLSSFIWLIEIQGTDRLSASDITAFLNENGLSVGTWKYKIDSKALEKVMFAEFTDISWLNIEIKGTKATVRLTETIPKQEIPDRSAPCDIVAKKDGLIVSIATSAGTPKLKAGDVVQAGDIIVSGELSIGDEDTGVRKEYVHAYADVRAKMYYEIKFTVPLQYSEKNFNGNSKRFYSIIVFGESFSFGTPKIPFSSYERTTSQKQLKLGTYYPLPVVTVTDEYREFTMTDRTRTPEQARQLASQLITSRIIREFDVESDVIDITTDFEQEDELIKVRAIITAIEKIDETREIMPAETAPHHG